MKTNKNLNALGMMCIDLTPNIKKELSGMQSQEILEVLCDDPGAIVGIPAWCRLTGNPLLDTKKISDSESVYYIKKK
jgi:TusA-related sulfurtransferase